MLKACWECIGGVRERNDEFEGTRLNGDSQRSPLWPEPTLDDKIMFLLPQRPRPGDSITVSGKMSSNPQSLTVRLITGYSSPDYSNIACQFDANFTTQQMVLSIVKDGSSEIVSGDYQQNQTSDLFTDTDYNFEFNIKGDGGSAIEILVAESFLERVQLKHSFDQIRFLSLGGDVQKVEQLNFTFGN